MKAYLQGPNGTETELEVTDGNCVPLLQLVEPELDGNKVVQMCLGDFRIRVVPDA